MIVFFFASVVQVVVLGAYRIRGMVFGRIRGVVFGVSWLFVFRLLRLP